MKQTVDNYLSILETLSYSSSLPHHSSSSDTEEPMLITSELNRKPRQVSTSTAVNYTDSYDSSPSNHLNRTGSSRQYVSSIQQAVDKNTKPNTITPSAVFSPLKMNPLTTFHEPYDTVQSSRRFHSSTSLSSTGYDSNSSPSMKSKRNSIATNNSSNDCLVHSTYSSSSSSPSSDDQQQQVSKPWVSSFS